MKSFLKATGLAIELFSPAIFLTVVIIFCMMKPVDKTSNRGTRDARMHYSSKEITLKAESQKIETHYLNEKN